MAKLCGCISITSAVQSGVLFGQRGSVVWILNVVGEVFC